VSETAQTLIKAALRVIGAYAPGETPTTDELADGLECLKLMLRHWSDNNMRIYYTKQDTKVLTGASSYTIGSGGDINTVRPASIRGAYVKDSAGIDSILNIIDEAKYRRFQLKTLSGTPEYLWYSPEYPKGKIYIYTLSTGTLYLDSLKPLTEPALITSTVEFPPGYDEAIKFNLAVRLAPEYGKEPSLIVLALAKSNLNDLEKRNFAEQINATNLELIKLTTRYNIEQG